MAMTRVFKPIAERTLANMGLKLERLNKPIDERLERLGERILEDQYKSAGDNFFFVQVGACDGVSFDAFFSFVTAHGLHGIAIEPLPDLYRELKANYAAFPSVTALNVGIHRTAQEMTMYRVSPEAKGLPDWVKGMASMDPQHHQLYGISSEHIIREAVPCITWDMLLEKQNIKRIDYLQLDTEGYDYEILNMLDFRRLRPAVIKFEHDLKKRPENKKLFAACIARLIENDYHILTLPLDAIAHSRLI